MNVYTETVPKDSLPVITEAFGLLVAAVMSIRILAALREVSP